MKHQHDSHVGCESQLEVLLHRLCRTSSKGLISADFSEHIQQGVPDIKVCFLRCRQGHLDQLLLEVFEPGKGREVRVEAVE